jgi:uncharacterized protein YfbU (UPF0304 family)
MPEDPLSRKERLLLFNDFLILRRLDPENEEHYKRCCEILEGGFEIEYEDVYGSVSEDVLPVSESRYVMDVLDLHLALKRSFDELEDKDGITDPAIRFRGFDGNNEGDLLRYAQYLREQGRWRELLENGDLNSHAHTYHRYQKMLALWQQVGDQWHMTSAEIKRVALIETTPGA